MSEIKKEYPKLEAFLTLILVLTAFAAGAWLYKLATESVPKKQTEIIFDSNDPYTEQKVRVYLTELHVKYINVCIAQMKLETANGTSNIFLNNNLFGSKFPTKRATTALGERNGHAYYSHWRQSVIDMALWQNYISNTENMESEEAYLNYVGKIYAEDDLYKIKIKKIINTLKQ